MNHSPLPKKKIDPAPASVALALMSFKDALDQLVAGKKVARASWPDAKEHCLLQNELLMIFRPDENYYHWTVARPDITANDWKIL